MLREEGFEVGQVGDDDLGAAPYRGGVMVDAGGRFQVNGLPVQLVRSDKIFGGVVGDVDALLGGTVKLLGHELKGAGGWFPVGTAEVFGADDVVEEGFEVEGLDFQFLGGEVAVGD